MHVCLVSREVKRGHWILPKLELLMAVCDYMDTGNRTRVLGKNS